MTKLEDIFKENGIKYIRQIYFNPINLDWLILNYKGHDHPNASGVDYNSNFYLFLLNNGFNIDGDNQEVYYLSLKNYKRGLKSIEQLNKNKADGIDITFYDKNVHYGYAELFSNLNNNAWKDVFEENIKKKEPNPMLVVVRDNMILGWTGPLYTQESKRDILLG